MTFVNSSSNDYNDVHTLSILKHSISYFLCFCVITKNLTFPNYYLYHFRCLACTFNGYNLKNYVKITQIYTYFWTILKLLSAIFMFKYISFDMFIQLNLINIGRNSYFSN